MKKVLWFDWGATSPRYKNKARWLNDANPQQQYGHLDLVAGEVPLRITTIMQVIYLHCYYESRSDLTRKLEKLGSWDAIKMMYVNIVMCFSVLQHRYTCFCFCPTHQDHRRRRELQTTQIELRAIAAAAIQGRSVTPTGVSAPAAIGIPIKL